MSLPPRSRSASPAPAPDPAPASARAFHTASPSVSVPHRFRLRLELRLELRCGPRLQHQHNAVPAGISGSCGTTHGRHARSQRLAAALGETAGRWSARATAPPRSEAVANARATPGSRTESGPAATRINVSRPERSGAARSPSTLPSVADEGVRSGFNAATRRGMFHVKLRAESYVSRERVDGAAWAGAVARDSRVRGPYSASAWRRTCGTSNDGPASRPPPIGHRRASSAARAIDPSDRPGGRTLDRRRPPHRGAEAARVTVAHHRRPYDPGNTTRGWARPRGARTKPSLTHGMPALR